MMRIRGAPLLAYHKYLSNIAASAFFRRDCRRKLLCHL